MSLIKMSVKTLSFTVLAFAVTGMIHGQTPPPAAQPRTTPAQPTNQPQMTPGGINQTPWYSNPQIRQELRLNADQFNSLNRAHEQAWTNYQKGVSGLDKNLSDNQRQQQMLELQRQYYKDFSGNSSKVLTDPTQLQRYNQLYYQYRGYGAFSDPAVASQLRLTPEQSTKLGQFQQEWSTQMSKLQPTFQSNKADAMKQYSTLQSQYSDRINSILTPDQQKTWQQMTGTPYNFNPNIYFPSTTSPNPGTTPPNPGK